MDSRKSLLRREKQDAYADFWHTIRIGAPITVLLFIFLPFLI